MGFIKNKLFIFIILILLQSCSGGRIGNFFESSFKNIEETKIKEDVKNNLKNKIVIKSGGIVEKNKNIEETKIKEDVKNNLKNKVLKMSEKKSKNNKKISDKNIFLQNKVYQPKSYKIIFILKDVDPKDPTEDLRTILRNSDVNFEIEKIERYFDPINKNIKSN
jgi:predicted small metal-binding protein